MRISLRSFVDRAGHQPFPYRAEELDSAQSTFSSRWEHHGRRRPRGTFRLLFRIRLRPSPGALVSASRNLTGSAPDIAGLWIVVRQTAVLLYLRRWFTRYHSDLPAPQSHVRNGYRRISDRLGLRILSDTYGRTGRCGNGRRHRSSSGIPPEYRFHRMVYTLGQCYLRSRAENGSSEVIGRVSGRITVRMFCVVEHFQCEEIGKRVDTRMAMHHFTLRLCLSPNRALACLISCGNAAQSRVCTAFLPSVKTVLPIHLCFPLSLDLPSPPTSQHSEL